MRPHLLKHGAIPWVDEMLPNLPQQEPNEDFMDYLTRLNKCGRELFQTLERELTTVTEQRDSYKDRFESLLKQYAIETHQLTEQRDRLAEDLNKMISICSCETEDIDTVNEIRYFVDTITKHSNP